MTTSKSKAMHEGGKLLGSIRLSLFDSVKAGATPREIETLAQKLIKETGGEPSFSMVPRYRWATCVCINEEVVHGIPESDREFKPGDVVMVDVGLYYENYHTDCAFTKLIEPGPDKKKKFIQAGKDALSAGLATISAGSHVGSISKAMGEVIISRGYTPARGLTGHGIGKILHGSPSIPTSYQGDVTETPILEDNDTIAVEIIYLAGKGDMYLSPDGWTILSADGKISAVFEETVEVKNDGYLILTQPPLFQR